VVAEAGRAAGIKFPVHPYMLRHATGFYLANAGQDTRAIQLYLGHKNIQHTVRCTELSGSKTFGTTDFCEDPTTKQWSPWTSNGIFKGVTSTGGCLSPAPSQDLRAE
jgi:hypothetical protein